MAAAEAVCGGDGLEEAEILDGLFRLVDRSLVVAAGGDPARPWLRRVAADYDNLRAALDRAMAAPDPDTALRLAGALGWYWWTDRIIEGRQRLADALALADGQPPTPQLARTLQAAAMVEVTLSPTAVTADQARRSRELFERFGDRWGAAFSELLLAWAQLQRAGPGEEGARLAEEAHATFVELGDLWGEAYAGRARFAFETYYRGLSDDAEAAGRRALAQFQSLDDQWGLAQTHFSLAEIARVRGDLERARQLHQEALAIVREVVGWSVPHTLAQLACAEARLGDLDGAEAHLNEAAGLLRTVPQPATAASVLVAAALVALGRDRPEEAARLLAAAEAVRERAGFTAVGAERHEADLAAESVRARLDADALAAAQADGRAQDGEDLLRDLVARAATRADH